MNLTTVAAIAACILTLHSPDHTELLVRSDSIRVVRSIAAYREHVAAGTSAVLYLGGPRGFAVRETAQQVLQMMRNCPSNP